MYKNKYIKYKYKYLQLKNKIGGKILTLSNIEEISEETDDHTISESISNISFYKVIPLRFYPGNFYLNYRLLKTINHSHFNIDDPHYNITNSFELEKIDFPIINEFNENNFKYLYKENIIINRNNIIPFDLLFLDSNYHILNNLNNFIKNNMNSINYDYFNKINKKLFHAINGISNIPNIFSKYLFINKILEFLKLLYNIDNGNIKTLNDITFTFICNNIYIKINSMSDEELKYNIKILIDENPGLINIDGKLNRLYNRRTIDEIREDLNYIKICIDILKLYDNKQAFINMCDTFNMYSEYNYKKDTKSIDNYSKFLCILKVGSIQ